MNIQEKLAELVRLQSAVESGSDRPYGDDRAELTKKSYRFPFSELAAELERLNEQAIGISNSFDTQMWAAKLWREQAEGLFAYMQTIKDILSVSGAIITKGFGVDAIALTSTLTEVVDKALALTDGIAYPQRNVE